MAAESFATAEDLAARWRPLSDVEAGQATILLGDASAMLRAEFPTIDDLDPALPVMVVCSMVKRAMVAGQDAAGVNTSQQTAGPYSQMFTYSNPMGDLYVTKAERRLLGGGRQRAFTIDMIPPWPDPDPWPWVTP